MNKEKTQFQSKYPISIIASIFIIIAGLKLAQAIVLPLLLAVFISILSAPILSWLKEKKVPNSVSLLIILLLIGIFGLLFAYIIGSSAGDFSNNIDFYEAQLKDKLSHFYTQFERFGFNLEGIQLNEILNPSKIIRFISSGLNQIGNVLTKSLLILIVVGFILLEATSMESKIKFIAQKRSAKTQKVKAFIKEFIKKVNKYMFIKTGISLLTGALITLFLVMYKIHYPVLWGFLAFILNFIPNIGSMIAAIPVIILAIIQFNFAKALLVLVTYVLINFIFGNIIEPKFMGQGLGLSPLIVFISLIFWGWLFGPIGMLLATPLTMVVKIALVSNDSTRWVAILIGSESELPKPE